jgi:hypothetical protein
VFVLLRLGCCGIISEPFLHLGDCASGFLVLFLGVAGAIPCSFKDACGIKSKRVEK